MGTPGGTSDKAILFVAIVFVDTPLGLPCLYGKDSLWISDLYLRPMISKLGLERHSCEIRTTGLDVDGKDTYILPNISCVISKWCFFPLGFFAISINIILAVVFAPPFLIGFISPQITQVHLTNSNLLLKEGRGGGGLC